MALEPTAIIPAVDVDHALLQLRLQQARQAQSADPPTKYWRDCFAPAETADELETSLSQAPAPAFAKHAAEVMHARAAEERNETPTHGCPHCGEMFYAETACKRHQRTCHLARRARKRSAPLRATAASATDINAPLRKMRLFTKTSAAAVATQLQSSAGISHAAQTMSLAHQQPPPSARKLSLATLRATSRPQPPEEAPPTAAATQLQSSAGIS